MLSTTPNQNKLDVITLNHGMSLPFAVYLDSTTLATFEKVSKAAKQPDYIWKQKVIADLISNPEEKKLLESFKEISHDLQSVFIQFLTTLFPNKLATKHIGTLKAFKEIVSISEQLIARGDFYKAIYYFLRMLEKKINKEKFVFYPLEAFKFNMDLWVERLIKKYGLNIHTRFNNKWLPIEGNEGFSYLHKAVIANAVSSMAMLVKNGISVNISYDQTTSLHLAVTYSKLAAAKWLVENHADINIADKKGYTPWMLAIKNNKLELIELLLPRANQALCTPGGQWNLLHIAAYCASTECFELVIKNNKLNIDSTDKYGNTSLHIAVKNNDLEKVWVLLKNGASRYILNNSSLSPIDLAKHQTNGSLMMFLLTQPITDKYSHPLYAYAKLIIENLSKENLCQAFSNGKKVHLYGYDKDSKQQYGAVVNNHSVNTTLSKHVVTFGMTFFVKAGKSFQRIPDFKTITDANAKQVLLDFLNGPGAIDKADALKFQVVANLLQLETSNDDNDSGKFIITLLKDILKSYMGPILKDREEIENNLFKL